MNFDKIDYVSYHEETDIGAYEIIHTPEESTFAIIYSPNTDELEDIAYDNNLFYGLPIKDTKEDAVKYCNEHYAKMKLLLGGID